MNTGRVMRSFGLETKYEFLKLLRTPAYAVFTLLFPLMFYVFFGLVMGKRFSGGSVPMATYTIGTYGAFGVIGVALFAIGVGVAVERGLGWLQIKEASPMPPFSYIAAKVAVSMLFSAALTGALLTLGMGFGGVSIPAVRVLLLIGTLMAGSVPFCLLGLSIGYFLQANSAPALVNTLHLSMAFVSGLWIPIQALPQALQSIAPILPPFHLGQIALSILGMPSLGSLSQHVGVLAAYTVVFGGLAWFGQTRKRETI